MRMKRERERENRYLRHSRTIMTVFPKSRARVPTYKRRRLGASERSRLVHRDGYRCQICFEPFLYLTPNRLVFEVDHMRSIKHGGTCEPEGLRCICPLCHRTKTAFDINPVLWEQLTGRSKYFAGPLARSPEHLEDYYAQLSKIMRVHTQKHVAIDTSADSSAIKSRKQSEFMMKQS